jgi:hypothetical protein
VVPCNQAPLEVLRTHWRVNELEKTLSPDPLPRLFRSPLRLSLPFERMGKTHRCDCNRCHGKMVCKSTFYNHNPRGLGGMYTRTPPRGATTSDNPSDRGEPPLSPSASGQSTDAVSGIATRSAGDGSHHGSNYVRAVDLLSSACQLMTSPAE